MASSVLTKPEQVKEPIVLIQVMLSYQVLHKDMIHTFTDVVDRDAEAFLNWRSSNYIKLRGRQ